MPSFSISKLVIDFPSNIRAISSSRISLRLSIPLEVAIQSNIATNSSSAIPFFYVNKINNAQKSSTCTTTAYTHIQQIP